MEVQLALFGGVIPGAVTLTLLALVWRRAARIKPAGEVSRGAWALPLLVAGAFAGADWVVNGVPQAWPDANNYRYVHAIALLAVLGVLDALIALPAWALFVARAATLGGVGLMLTEGYAPHAIAWEDLAGWLAVLSIGGAGLLAAGDRGARGVPAYVTSGVLAAGAFFALPALFLIGSAYGAQVGASFVAVTVAAGLAGLIVRRATLPRGLVTVVGGGLFALLIGAGVQWEPKSVPAILIAAMVPAALGASGAIAGARPVLRLIAGIVFSAVLAGGAAGLAYNAGAADAGDDDYSDYGY